MRRIVPVPLTLMILLTLSACDRPSPDSAAESTPSPDTTRVARQAVLDRIEVDASTGELSLRVRASAYNSVPEQTDSLPNEGAWGDPIEEGMKIVAVSPDLLAAGLDRGTELTIEGLDGTWRVLDQTASRHRNRIDIYMGVDVDAALDWGIREVTIRWIGEIPID